MCSVCYPGRPAELSTLDVRFTPEGEYSVRLGQGIQSRLWAGDSLSECYSPNQNLWGAEFLGEFVFSRRVELRSIRWLLAELVVVVFGILIAFQIIVRVLELIQLLCPATSTGRYERPRETLQ